MAGIEATKDTIYSVADFHDVELERVEPIDTDTSGQTYKVLETDAEQEVDQVGFTITYPQGPMAEQTFRDQLKRYFQALKDRGDDSDGDDDHDDVDATVTETPDEDPRDGASADNSQGSDAETTAVDRAIESQPKRGTIAVELTDESAETLREELESVVGNVDDVDDRLDELDERLSRVEEALGALSAFDPDGGGDGGG